MRSPGGCRRGRKTDDFETPAPQRYALDFASPAWCPALGFLRQPRSNNLKPRTISNRLRRASVINLSSSGRRSFLSRCLLTSQSRAFFKEPGSPWAYSGVEISSASDAASSRLSRSTPSGRSSGSRSGPSWSGSKWGKSRMLSKIETSMFSGRASAPPTKELDSRSGVADFRKEP